MESKETMVNKPIARKVSCVELYMSDDEAVFVVEGMQLLQKVAEQNKCWDEAQNWEDLIIRTKRAAIPRWILESRENRTETTSSPERAG